VVVGDSDDETEERRQSGGSGISSGLRLENVREATRGGSSVCVGQHKGVEIGRAL
jgi:hypothetical protein